MDVLSYTGGIIDGEGTIACIKRKEGKYFWYQETVRVHMKHEIIPKWLQKNFGGSYYAYDKREKQERIWQLMGIKARDFCKIIKPYLVEKQEQADLIIELDQLKAMSKSFQKDPSNVAIRKNEIYEKLKKLHKS